MNDLQSIEQNFKLLPEPALLRIEYPDSQAVRQTSGSVSLLKHYSKHMTWTSP